MEEQHSDLLAQSTQAAADLLVLLLGFDGPAVQQAAYQALAAAASGESLGLSRAAAQLAAQAPVQQQVIMYGLSSAAVRQQAAQLLQAAIASPGGLQALEPWSPWLACYAAEAEIGAAVSGVLAQLEEDRYYRGTCCQSLRGFRSLCLLQSSASPCRPAGKGGWQPQMPAWLRLLFSCQADCRQNGAQMLQKHCPSAQAAVELVGGVLPFQAWLTHVTARATNWASSAAAGGADQCKAHSGPVSGAAGWRISCQLFFAREQPVCAVLQVRPSICTRPAAHCMPY